MNKEIEALQAFGAFKKYGEKLKNESKKEMIDAIYKEIANKELRDGLRIQETRFSRKKDEIIKNIITHKIHSQVMTFDSQYEHISKTSFYCVEKKDYPQYSCETYILNIENSDDSEFKIIGHPVLIGDVLEWIYNGDNEFDDEKKLIFLCNWDDFKLPIEQQSELCITYIFNLLPKGEK